MMDGPIRQRRIKRRTMRNGIVGAVVLVVILAAYFALQTYLTSRAEAEHAAIIAASEQTAAKIADRINQSVAPAISHIEQLADSAAIKKAFMTAAASPEPQIALNDASADKAQTVEGLLKLRLLMPGDIALDIEGDPPLSYASLDMLDQAQSATATKAPDAELHMPGSERAHIVIVRRVTDADGNLIGLIHASLSPALLQQALADLENIAGYLEIKQFVSDTAPVVLFRQGEAAYKQNIVSQTVPVPDGNWTISYWPPTAGSATDAGGRLLPVVAIGLVVLLLGSLLLKRRRSAGRRGSEDYGGAVKAFIDGAHPSLGKLIPDLPRGKNDKAAADSSVPVAEPERDDITRVVTPAAAPPAAKAETIEVPASIFRSYDIRGLVETELTPPVVEQLGRAIGSEARARQQQGVIVGCDGRLSSPTLVEALSQGLRAAGIDVIDIGLVATPVLYYATHYLEAKSGVMITGSHNGPEYNGLKIVLGGETLSGDTVKALYQRIQEQDFTSGNGARQTADITSDYIRRVTEDIPVALGNAFKIVVDCGNGAAAKIAPQVYRAMGHDIVELYCEIDGNFPNHHPDPSQPENLQDLIAKVKETGADLGLAFDGDGDRLGVVDGDGNIIWPDRQLMLLARDVLSRNAGAPIIFDVKCSRYLKAIIQSAGGKPLMWKTGHSLIKSKMKEVNAPLAGEMSGHIFFKERWYGFDDAIYTGARLLEILAKHEDRPTTVLAELPDGLSTHELRIGLPETRHAEVMQALKDQLSGESGELITVDGLRIDYSDGWGLIRASNTSPYLVARFEAENQAALERIQSTFRNAIQTVDPTLGVPF